MLIFRWFKIPISAPIIKAEKGPRFRGQFQNDVVRVQARQYRQPLLKGPYGAKRHNR